jgi:hypothetical protein
MRTTPPSRQGKRFDRRSERRVEHQTSYFELTTGYFAAWSARRAARAASRHSRYTPTQRARAGVRRERLILRLSFTLPLITRTIEKALRPGTCRQTPGDGQRTTTVPIMPG